MIKKDRVEQEREVRQLYHFVAEQVIAGLYKADIIDTLIELGVDRYTAGELVEEMEARLRRLQARRVLVVLPEGSLARALQKGLKAAGYEFRGVSGVRPAMTAVREIVPDIFVVEHLPEVFDALAFLTSLRKMPIGRKLPGFVICPRKGLQDAFAVFQLVDCLARPVTAADIVLRIKKVLLVPQRFRT